MKEEGPLDEHFDVNPNSAHHEDQGQMIYFVKIRIAYKVRRGNGYVNYCLLYTSPSPRDGLLSRMPSSA